MINQSRSSTALLKLLTVNVYNIRSTCNVLVRTQIFPPQHSLKTYEAVSDDQLQQFLEYLKYGSLQAASKDESTVAA